MGTYFISDLHLDSSHPKITSLFLDFLTHDAIQADHLYILGDLFEVWVGDDEQTELQKTVAHALHQLAERGVPISFMPGNRDFLLGKRYAKQCAMSLLSDPVCLDLYGQRTLLMHGDTLCQEDIAYQRFRRVSHHPITRALFLLMPLRFRIWLAYRCRETSESEKAKKQQQSEKMMDVTTEAVIDAMAKHQAKRLIHGHTHHPAIHTLPNQAERIVLAAWHEQGHALIVSPDSTVTMKYF